VRLIILLTRHLYDNYYELNNYVIKLKFKFYLIKNKNGGIFSPSQNILKIKNLLRLRPSAIFSWIGHCE